MNTDKNSVISSIDTWVHEIEAMQEDREDKQAELTAIQEKKRISGQTCWILEQLVPRRLAQ